MEQKTAKRAHLWQRDPNDCGQPWGPPMPEPKNASKAGGSYSVMAQRREPPRGLDYFPTPPWATRALFERVLPRIGYGVRGGSILEAWDPACGEGHMAEVMVEYIPEVVVSDVWDYGYGKVQDFLGTDPRDAGFAPGRLIATNPPFNAALQFQIAARAQAPLLIALLCRTAWVEGVDRYESLFAKDPPALIAQFVERVPMTKHRWEPAGSTATAYAWFVWQPAGWLKETRFMWIPPGQRRALSKPDDVQRFKALERLWQPPEDQQLSSEGP